MDEWDDIQDDLDSAAEHHQQMLEQQQREQELLARAPQFHAELKRIEKEVEETFARMRKAVTELLK